MKMMTGIHLFLKDNLQFILTIAIIYFVNSRAKSDSIIEKPRLEA